MASAYLLANISKTLHIWIPSQKPNKPHLYKSHPHQTLTQKLFASSLFTLSYTCTKEVSMSRASFFVLSGLLLAQNGPSWGRAAVDSADCRVPKYMVSPVTNTSTRVPYVAYLYLQGLEPSKTYRYVVRADNSTAPATSLNVNAGAGNPIYYDEGSGSFTRTTAPSLYTSGGYGTLTTDASGYARLYFILEPTSNSRFAAGNQVYAKVLLLEDNLTDSAVVIASQFPITTIAFGSSCTDQDTCGSFLYDSITPGRVPSRFVFLYDEYLLGPNPNYFDLRPISGAIIEPTGIAYPTSYLVTYRNEVASKPGRWGTIIPNNLPNGIRSIIYGTSLVSDTVGIYDRDGNWPSGISTVNPNNGPAAVGLLMSLRYPLPPRPSLIRPPDGWNPQYGAFVWRNLSTNPICTGCDGIYYISSDRLPDVNAGSSFSDSCLYSGYFYSSLPQVPVDSEAVRRTVPQWDYWYIIGGPGWGNPAGGADSLLVSVGLFVPLGGTATGVGAACGDPMNPGNCLPCEISCQTLFSGNFYNWYWETRIGAFANEAGYLVRNYIYSNPSIYSHNATGSPSQMGTPNGLYEVSGANLNNLDVSITPQLHITANLPYEALIFPVYPFMFDSYQASLNWQLLDASNNVISFGTEQGTVPSYSDHVEFDYRVDVSSLRAGTYRIEASISVQAFCSPSSPGPLALNPIIFTVATTSGVGHNLATQVRLRTYSDRWVVEGLSPDLPAMLYSTQGQLIWQGLSNANGHLSIPREGLQAGVYLLSVGGKTWRLAHMP